LKDKKGAVKIVSSKVSLVEPLSHGEKKTVNLDPLFRMPYFFPHIPFRSQTEETSVRPVWELAHQTETPKG